MKIIFSKDKLIDVIANDKKLGFVPTMGAIHIGHVSLIKKSIKQCPKTLVSIFINKPQFNNKKDFNKYPRKLKSDIKILKKLNINYLYLPFENDIYPYGKNSNMKIASFHKKLCGKSRPGHFNAVVDVIDRFIKIINPGKIYFGEKDYQQFKIIDQLAKKKFSKIIIKGVETVRDETGLAFSTRNNLLNSNSKEIYSKFIFNMKNFINSLDSGLEISTANNLVRDFIKDTNTGIGKFDYHEFRSDSDLSLKGTINDSRFFLAFYLNSTRLIDNFKID